VKLLKNKNYTYLLFPLIFTLPIAIFGINDIEEYMLGTFSTLIFWEDLPKSLFTFFYDFYGPGTKLPLGSGPLLHPLNFFLFDFKLYYVIFVITHLIIQLEYSKKLLKLFNIKYNIYILSILLVFCLPNILFALSDDWISCFFSYSFFPVIFYYFEKIIRYQKSISYLKFSLFFGFWIINGHLGHISTYIIFFIIYFFLSIKNFNHLFKIFNFYFLVSLIFILLVSSNYLFFLIRELSYFNGWRVFQGTYELRHFIEILFPSKNFITKFGYYRLPGNPILIYFCLIISIISLFKFIKPFFKESFKFLFKSGLKLLFVQINTDLNFKFCFLFILFLIFSLLPFLSIITTVSAGYMARDIFLYLGIFIFFINIKRLNYKFKLIINFLLIFYSLLFFIINIENKISVNHNNFIVNKNIDSNLSDELKNLNLSKKDYKRIYFSPDLFSKYLRFEEDGIFAINDFIKFNLAPFNGYFKYTSKRQFGDETKLMDGIISSHFNLINNNFFLNLFKINFLLIKETEVEKLKNKEFKLIKNIKTSKGNLFLFKKNIINYSVSKNNLDLLIADMKNCKERELVSGAWINIDSKLDCLLRNKKLFDQSNHHLSRVSNGIFHIKNIKTNNYPVIPFIFDENWKSSNDNIINLNNFLILINNDNSLDKNVIISYEDNTRYFLKIISIVSFFILILFIIFYRQVKSYI
jgi:hypothetical protein